MSQYDQIIHDYCDSVNYTQDLILSMEQSLGIKFPGIKINSVNHNLESGKFEFSIEEGLYSVKQIDDFLDEISGRTKKKK